MSFLKINFCTLALIALFLPPANAAIEMETGDGLPIEVEFVRIERNEVTIQNTASKREMKFNLQKIAPPIKEKIEAIIKERRTSIQTISLRAVLEDNPSAAPIPLTQAGFLNPSEETSAGSAKTLPARARTIRLSGAGDPAWGVDLPLNVTVFWFAQLPGDSSWRILGSEPVKLNLTSTRADFIARPPSFARTAYRGFAVIAINPANGLIVWKNASAAAFQQAAEEKIRMSK